MERKKNNERTDGQVSRDSPLSLRRYKTIIVPERYLTKYLTLVYMEKKNERTNEQISRESPLSLTRFTTPSLHSIASLRLLAFKVSETIVL